MVISLSKSGACGKYSQPGDFVSVSFSFLFFSSCNNSNSYLSDRRIEHSGESKKIFIDLFFYHSMQQYGYGSPGPQCFKTITITYGGKSTQATIMDEVRWSGPPK